MVSKGTGLASIVAMCFASAGIAQDAETDRTEPASTETPSGIKEQLKLTPHPLAGCERKKRKLTCDAMTTKGGFIVNINLRDNGRTIQYQISAFSSVRNNLHFIDGFEERVREHMQQAVPIAAEIMGWDADAPETLAMVQDAYAALGRLEVSLDPIEAGPDDDFLARAGLASEDYSAGSFYSNRGSFSNSYSLYLWKPGFKKKRR